MLLIGDHNCIPRDEVLEQLTRKKQLVIFNFSSYIEGYPRLNNLLPHGLDTSTEESIDMSYFNYVMNNDLAFIDMMFIINELYKGNNVYLIITHNEFYDMLIESFMQILKYRYGIIAYYVNDFEDMISYRPKFDQSEFSMPGLFNLDADKARFVMLLDAYHIIPPDTGVD